MPLGLVSKSCTIDKLVSTMYARARLLKRWIALSTGYVTFQRISIRETNCVIH